MNQYRFELSEWDKTKGIGPQILTQARERAMLVAMENQNPALTTNETQFYRGVYAEIMSLVEVLEKAGVSNG